METRGRQTWIDNTKGGLILLVVIGHFCASIVRNNAVIEILYKLINFFHMPCFLLISAYLSKSRIQSKQYLKIFERLIIPYLVAQLALWLFACIFPGGLNELSNNYQTIHQLVWLKPNYHLWFLFALIVYHIITPLLPQNKPILCISIAFVLSILVGYAPEIPYLRFNKIVAYYPLFLIGFFSDKNFWLAVRGDNQHRFTKKLLALFIVIIWIILFSIYRQQINASIFSMATSYSVLIKRGVPYPAIQRMLFLIGSILVSLSIINMIPNKTGIFTQLGVRSMYVYILHGFFVIALRATNDNIFPIFKRINSTPEYIMYILLSIILAYLLASKWSVKIFKRFLEPQIEFFHHRKSS